MPKIQSIQIEAKTASRGSPYFEISFRRWTAYDPKAGDFVDYSVVWYWRNISNASIERCRRAQEAIVYGILPAKAKKENGNG